MAKKKATKTAMFTMPNDRTWRFGKHVVDHMREYAGLLIAQDTERSLLVAVSVLNLAHNVRDLMDGGGEE